MNPDSPMKNSDVAEMFDEIADLLEVKGDASYRVQAYRRAARSVAESREPLEVLSRERRLEEIPNVGDALAAKIEEALGTGQMRYLENLRQEVPREAHALMQIPGIGGRTAGRLVREAGIRSVEELEEAAKSGRLAGHAGLGQKSVQNILAGIERYRSRPDRIPLVDALEIVAQVERALGECGALRRLTPTGSIRRRLPTIGDVDLIAVSDDPEAAMDCFVHMPGVKEILAHGPAKSFVVLGNGRQADLRIVPEEQYGSILHHFTGSREHNIQLRDFALDRGIRINDYGMEDLKTGHVTSCATEEEVYDRLGMDYVPPEIRQGAGEIEAALEHRLPRLIEAGDLKGDLHAHTNYSDGADTIREMAMAALDLGYEYLAVTDHSQGRTHAGGLSPERLREQGEEIRRINGELQGITLLHGTEVDIRSDGTLDYPDEILAGLDFVVASVHSNLHQPREKITERLVRAARHPLVNVIGHPTGRLLCKREGSDVDLEALFQACKESGTALEVSGVPLRLDLDGTAARRARDLGVILSVNTDSHRTRHLSGWRDFALGQARRGWLEPAHVLNTRTLTELQDFLKQKRF